MDKNEAKRLLLGFRSRVDDEEPMFREALALAETDPELKAWLVAERQRTEALQGKLREIEPPDDLLFKIIRQKPALPPPPRKLWRFAQAAAAVAVLCGLAFFWLRPAPKNSFAGYEQYLAGLVAKKYRMSLETDNLDKIRSFLANNQAPADYVLNSQLEKTRALGCATLSWNGNPVSMLCFSDAANRKLFLFVVNREAIPDAPGQAAGHFQQVGQFSVAGWTQGGRSYVLAVEGDDGMIHRYL